MKRLLLINWRDIRNPEAGGAETYYHEIFKRVARSGDWDVTVLAHAVKGMPAREEVEGTHVIRIGSRSLFNFAAARFVMQHQREFDLIVEDLNKVPFFTRLYARRPRLHMVMHFFGASIFREIAFPMAAYIYSMERLVSVAYRGEQFLAISESTRSDIRARCGRRTHVDIVEPGIDIDFFHSTLPKDAVPTLVYFGRIKKYKNVQFVIRCLPEIRKRFPTVRLVAAGAGDYLPELKRLCASCGVENAVEFPGFVTEEAKRDILSRSTLMVNPSIKEGWGITNIEANLCGTVSVSANVHGLRDSVRDGETGLLYVPDNAQDFIAKVCGLLSNEGRRRTMEQRALEFARGFSWDAMTERMRKVLAESLRSTGTR